MHPRAEFRRPVPHGRAFSLGTLLYIRRDIDFRLPSERLRTERAHCLKQNDVI